MILNNLSQPAAEREGRIKVTIQTWAASYDSKPLWADNAKSREREDGDGIFNLNGRALTVSGHACFSAGQWLSDCDHASSETVGGEGEGDAMGGGADKTAGGQQLWKRGRAEERGARGRVEEWGEGCEGWE